MSKRKVKCKYCLNELLQCDAYGITNEKEKKEYFCNEDHYIKRNNDKKNREIILNCCDEIFGLKVSMDKLFLKELKIFLETSKGEVVANYLKDNILELDMAMSDKNFNLLNYKIKYFFAIVRKNIDVYKKIADAEKKEELYSELEIIENVSFKPRHKKKTISEIIRSEKLKYSKEYL